MKKILLIGDSIIEGKLGVNFVEQLEKEFEEYTFINAGIGGDTVLGVTNRIQGLLNEEAIDYVIVAIGHNDLILPSFLTRGFMYRMAFRQIIKRGSIPSRNFKEFIATYKQLIDILKVNMGTKFACTTMSTLNENPQSVIAKARKHWNNGLRQLFDDEGVTYIDIGRTFDREIAKSAKTDYFMESFISTFISGEKKTGDKKQARILSNSRHLSVTIDGVHLSVSGGEIYYKSFAKLLTYVFGKK